MGKNAPIPDRKVLSRPPVYTLLSLLLELEQMQVLWRLGQERRWFSEQQLLFSSRKLDEAGRMANGWRGQLASGVQLRRSGILHPSQETTESTELDPATTFEEGRRQDGKTGRLNPEPLNLEP